ncbi:unnamed protein product [Arabidopsis arenosa]|uniref:Jacalin-type lectin domain-containing protein n=1 Tax=Arabidopsis arenosa TaxID=38785 RepID=A0A8S1ZR11_ARAAE|nr:unnamed protein product [Arabidopsis arenosa]
MSWDDGKHTKVKRVQLTFDDVIRSIEVEYDGTSLKSQPRGPVGTTSDGFTLSSDEYVTEVNGYYKTTFSGEVITSLTFKTNKRTYGTYGNKTRNYFSVTAPTDNQIVGFLGSSSHALNSINAHFAPAPPSGSTGTKPGASGIGSKDSTTGSKESNTGGKESNTGNESNTSSSPQKLEAQEGKEGNQWDDGADHDGVMKIHVAAGGLGIDQIRFDYVKNGQSKEGPFHGVKRRSGSSTFVINHPEEYLVSVEGWYDSSNIIQGIQFKSNKHTSQYFGYEFSGDGKQFSLHVNDKKIIGFHGFADSHLTSLGAYFVPISSSSSSLTPPPNKVKAQGGNYGETFDDGAFDHVRKVYVGQGDSGVAYVKFDYEKDGKIETREHGKMTLLATEEFEVDLDDFITSMEVYVDKVYGYKSEIVVALTFKTFKGKTSPRFGVETENKYEVKDGKGGKLAGFHGKASDVLYALGAYFTPTAI